MSAQKRISVVASAISPDPREAAARSRTIGFDGLQFDAVSSAINLPELSITGRREFQHVMRASAQTIVALRGELGRDGLGPSADIDRVLASLDKIANVARDLKAQCVTIDLGPLPEPIDRDPAKPRIAPEEAGLIIIPITSKPVAASQTRAAPPPDPAMIASIDTALAALGEIADRYQVFFVFSSSLASFAAIDRAMNTARCPWFGIDLDPIAMLIDRWSADEIFSRLGNSIQHVRARDALLGGDHRTKAVEIGRGNVKWDALLAALDSAGYSGWLTIDPVELSDGAGSASRGLAHLRSIIGT